MSEENLFLKIVTAGKLHKKSLVFHFQCDDCTHEFQIKRVHTGSINLRLAVQRLKFQLIT